MVFDVAKQNWKSFLVITVSLLLLASQRTGRFLSHGGDDGSAIPLHSVLPTNPTDFRSTDELNCSNFLLTRHADGAERKSQHLCLDQLADCQWEYPAVPGRPFDWFAAHMAGKLAFISRALAKNHILWWADYGTLLGLVRHGGQIPFVDWDADLAIPFESFDEVVHALTVETIGSPFFVGRVFRSKASSSSKRGSPSATQQEPRVSIGSVYVTRKCRAQYNVSYPGVLDGDHPWHVDISFVLRKDRTVTRFCRCRYYNVSLVCPEDAVERLNRLYPSGWYRPDACRFLPSRWCVERPEKSKALSATGTPIPVIDIRQDEPSSTDVEQLALCGIHPWLRLSNESTWCRQPPPKSVVFRKNRRGHGELLPVGHHRCKWAGT